MTAVFKKPLSETLNPRVVSFSSRSPGFFGAAIDLNAVADTVLLRMLETTVQPVVTKMGRKPDGMLYDFPVRLSVTVRDSVLALEVAGCPMSLS